MSKETRKSKPNPRRLEQPDIELLNPSVRQPQEPKDFMSAQLTVRLPGDLDHALADAASRMRRKRAEIVRMALYQYLQFPQQDPHPRIVFDPLSARWTAALLIWLRIIVRTYWLR